MSTTTNQGRIDIHNIKGAHEAAIKYLKKADISDKNKKLILDYDKVRMLEARALHTRVGNIYKLINAARVLEQVFKDKETTKDCFSEADREEIKEMVCRIGDNPRWGKWTTIKIQSNFKRFFKFVRYGDDYAQEDYPDEVKWIKTHLSKRDEPKVDENDVLSEDEFKKLIEAAWHPMIKAWIACHSETGARISEDGNMTVGDVLRDEYSFKLRFTTSKTKPRVCRVYYSQPYLAHWLNIHPQKDNLNAPLWIQLGIREVKPLMYDRFVDIMHELYKRAGINKKPRTHLIRHSRITINSRKGWTWKRICDYFGLVPSSGMIEVYDHTSIDDANMEVLRMYGVKVKQDNKKSPLKLIQCPTCSFDNPPTNKLCDHCGLPLRDDAPHEIEHQKHKVSNFMDYCIQDPLFKEILKRKSEEYAKAQD